MLETKQAEKYRAIYKHNSYPSYAVFGNWNAHPVSLSWLSATPTSFTVFFTLICSPPWLIHLSFPLSFCGGPGCATCRGKSCVFSAVFMSSDSTGSWLMGFLKPRNNAITLSISLRSDKTTAGLCAFFPLWFLRCSLGTRLQLCLASTQSCCSGCLHICIQTAGQDYEQHDESKPVSAVAFLRWHADM